MFFVASEVERAQSKAPSQGAWVKDSDLTVKLDEQLSRKSSFWSTVGLAYGSLGVIYGDIGTSLIYVFPAIFQDQDLSTEPREEIKTDIYGAISLIFWTLTLITLIKYIGIVLAANDTGEGGIVALYALLCRTMGISPFGTMKSQDFQQVQSLTSASPTGPLRPRLGEHRFKENARAKRREDKAVKVVKTVTPIFRSSHGFHNLLTLDGTKIVRWFRRFFFAQRIMLVITMLATGLIIGDGILMPAFSVVSAISGLKRSTNIGSDGQIVGISIAILAVLFFFQHIGTKRIGFLFSPIIIIWLLCNLGVGIYNLHKYGGHIFEGLSPHYIVIYFNSHPTAAWQSLSGVLLCVTGTETMFAAMGHFSRGAIAVAFGLFTYPCLMISYLGQGAYLLQFPENVMTAFWSSIPNDFYWPMLVLATLAAVVASQAAITGTFSLLRQAMALGIFPKLKIIHTGDVVEGQIFIPVINYSLMALCIAVVAGFRGDNLVLADAYGVAVISVMVITTLMTILIMLTAWETTLLLVIPFACLFLLIEGGFLSSSLKKVPQGAWFAIVVSFTFACIMFVWWLGSLWRRRVVIQRSKDNAAQDMFSVKRAGEAAEGKSGSKKNKREFDSCADINVSAAGYAIYGQKDEPVEDKLAVQLAAALAGSNKGANHGDDGMRRFLTGGVSQYQLDLNTLGRFDRSSAPISQRPMLGRFSASPAPASRPTPAPAALSLNRVSGGNHILQSVVEERSSKDPPRPPVIPSVPVAMILVPEEHSADLPHPLDAADPACLDSTPKSVVPGAPPALGQAVGPNLSLDLAPTTPRTAPAWHRNASMVTMQDKPEKPLSLLSGLGIYYSESPVGIPEVMRHFLRNVDALHGVAIFLTVRFLPMPTVKHSERLLVKSVFGVPNFYQVVARYGYQDIVDHGRAFIAQVKATILHKLEIKAGLRSMGVSDDVITGLEDEDVEDDGGHGGGRAIGARVSISHPFGLPAEVDEADLERYTEERLAHDVGVRGSKVDLMDGLPMMSKFADDAMDKLAEAAIAPNASMAVLDAYEAACALFSAFDEGVVYYLGRTWTRSRPNGRNPVHNLVIGTFFRTMELLAFNDSEAWQIPLDNMVELGMTVEV